MRVVDTRDFCIPSDENDYDELVAFADTMANIPQFDAVPIEMLDKIRAEIEQIKGNKYEVSDMQGNRYKYETIEKAEALQIIDKYKAESENKGMSEISEVEIKAMSKEQNYLRGYSDGKSDTLDKIRAEIEQGYCKVENEYDRGRNMGLHIAMQIIDKYRESEGD